MDDRRQFMNDGSWMMNNSYERWFMDDEQQLWMTVMDGGRQFMDDGGWMMDDGGGQSLVEHFAGNKTMECVMRRTK